MRGLLLSLLLAVSPSFAAQRKSAPSGKAFAAAGAALSNPAVSPVGAAPGAALSLLPKASNLALNPAVVSAMANPVPAAAMGLPAAYFTTSAGSPATAVSQAARAGAASDRAVDRVYDGSHGRSDSVSGPPPVAVEPHAPSDLGYLREVRGLSGRKLLDALKPLTSRAHRTLDYNEAKAALFSRVERVYVEGAPGVVDAYSGAFVPAEGTGSHGSHYREGGDRNGDGRVSRLMTAEHVVPQSILDDDPDAKGDLHNLVPAWEFPNERRGSLPFGPVEKDAAVYTNNGGARFSETRAQPPEISMGKFARIVFYNVARRPEIFRDEEGRRFLEASLPALLRWNVQHPPTPAERRRNEAIEAEQGNRNPFVDDPLLAARIWGAPSQKGRVAVGGEKSRKQKDEKPRFRRPFGPRRR